MRSGGTIRGVMRDRGVNGLVLGAAQVAGVDGNNRVKWTRLDGDTVIPVENIDYWQEGTESLEVLT